MKRLISLSIIISVLLMACSNKEVVDLDNEIEVLTGYIVIDGNNVLFKRVEIVDSKDKEKMEEFKLSESDMVENDFVIIDYEDKRTYKLANKVDYTFTDVYLNFIKEPDGDRIYHTEKKDEFLKHLGEYDLNDIPLSDQKIPYIIEVNNGEVISITEEFKYTI